MIGSPIVFQTAPPQPWSNALATWPYVFVGGPDASQKGLGLWIPAKLVLRSAIGPPAQEFVDLLRCRDTFSGGIHDLRSAVGDRKSTRLNSSHGYISYAVFCLKKKKKNI